MTKFDGSSATKIKSSSFKEAFPEFPSWNENWESGIKEAWLLSYVTLKRIGQTGAPQIPDLKGILGMLGGK